MNGCTVKTLRKVLISRENGLTHTWPKIISHACGHIQQNRIFFVMVTVCETFLTAFVHDLT